MEQWINEITNRPELTLASLALAVISIVLAIYFYTQQRREKIPTYRKLSKNLVRELSSTFQRISVLYDGAPVPNFTVTKIFFWNRGKESISASDIAEKEPVIIASRDEVKILDVRIFHTSRPANNFRIAVLEKGSRYAGEFDFVDYLDLAVIQVMHTALGNNSVELNGTIKGERKLFVYREDDFKELLTGIILGCITFLLFMLPYKYFESIWIYLVGLFCSFFVSALSVRILIRREERMFPGGRKPFPDFEE